MSNQEGIERSYEEFVDETLLGYADELKPRLAYRYLRDDVASLLVSELTPRIIRGDETGSEVPTVAYESSERLWLNIEPDSILDKADNMAEHIGEVSPGDVAKLLVSAGVGKAVLAYKLRSSLGGNQHLMDSIFAKQQLIEAIEFDEIVDADLSRPNLVDLGDDEVDKINALRFGFGVSYPVVFSNAEHVDSIRESFKKELSLDEQTRSRDLRMALGIFTLESALYFHRTTLNHIVLAGAYPMDYNEILDLFS